MCVLLALALKPISEKVPEPMRCHPRRAAAPVPETDSGEAPRAAWVASVLQLTDRSAKGGVAEAVLPGSLAPRVPGAHAHHRIPNPRVPGHGEGLAALCPLTLLVCLSTDCPSLSSLIWKMGVQ